MASFYQDSKYKRYREKCNMGLGSFVDSYENSTKSSIQNVYNWWLCMGGARQSKYSTAGLMSNRAGLLG